MPLNKSFSLFPLMNVVVYRYMCRGGVLLDTGGCCDSGGATPVREVRGKIKKTLETHMDRAFQPPQGFGVLFWGKTAETRMDRGP